MATTATARRSPATKPTARRPVRGNSDARDAVLREAEHARQTTVRSIQAQEGVKMVERSELKHIVDDMPDNYVQCRAFGHGRALANYEVKRGIRSYTLYCPTCKFARHIVMDRNGDIVEDKPDWPEGYLLPKGSGRIGADTKGIVRLATIDRLVKPRTQRRKAS